MIPQGTHTDWPWPFSLVPRSANAVSSATGPRYIIGSQVIPKPGSVTLQTSRYGAYFAVTLRNHWHFRIGTFRYDDVDKYYTFPTFTVKKLAR